MQRLAQVPVRTRQSPMLPSAAPLASIVPSRLKLIVSMGALDCPKSCFLLTGAELEEGDSAVGVTERGLVR